jgi:hypothetical protein
LGVDVSNANKSAFPQEIAYLYPDQTVTHQGPFGGLTKLEYFAGLAMNGILAADASDSFDDEDAQAAVNASVFIARALLAKLEKPQ